MPPDSLPSATRATPHDIGDIARSLIVCRRRREEAFGAAAVLFGDPAWTILLDLYVQEGARRRVSVSSACIAAGTAPTTGLRWIGRLERAGLITRTADPRDGRRAFIALTPRAREALARTLASAPLLA